MIQDVSPTTRCPAICISALYSFALHLACKFLVASLVRQGPLLLQGREACWVHEGVRDIRDDLPVDLRGRGYLLPFGVRYEGMPQTLPLRERVPAKDVDELKV